MNEDLGDFDERQDLAKDENTAPEVLARLAEDDDWRVRINVAENANTPVDTLCELSKDNDWHVSLREHHNFRQPSYVHASHYL